MENFEINKPSKERYMGYLRFRLISWDTGRHLRENERNNEYINKGILVTQLENKDKYIALLTMVPLQK